MGSDPLAVVSPQLEVRGSDGIDNLGLFMWTQNPPAIALLDGGAGIDFGIGTPNVKKINFP